MSVVSPKRPSPTTAPDQPPAGYVERSASPPLVAVEGVSRSFGNVTVIDDVTFEVHPGEVFALIGPSAAGKSTLVEIMIGLLTASRGTVRVLDKAPAEFGPVEREAIGYVPQSFSLYANLTVIRNVRFVAGLYGLGWRQRGQLVRDVLETVGLWDVRNRAAANISGGMKRRLSLACGLVHRPRLLFVDEPTAGLDPELRVRIWDHLRTLADGGTTIVVTTQHLDEAERCDRVGVLNDGMLVALGTPAELRQRAIGGHAIDLETRGFDSAAGDALRALPEVRDVEPNGWSGLRVVVDNAGTATPAVLQLLNERDIIVDTVHAYEPTFDEVFLTLVRRHRDQR